MYRKYLGIAVAIIFTGFISLSIHFVIYQHFHAPDIKINPSFDQIINFAIRFCTVVASVLIYVSSKKHWLDIHPVKRIILFAVLIMALTESLLRGTIMNLIVGNSWQNQFLLTISSYLKFFSLSCVLCLLGNLNFKNNYLQWLYYLLLIFLATIIFYLIGNIAQKILVPLAAYLPNTENPIHPPYGLNVLVPAYITYLEPTIASFILFYLVRDKIMTFNILIQGIIIGAIIALLHGGLYSVIQIIYSEGNFLYRGFYYGQFWWEYFVLGVLTAYSYDLLIKQLK
jgi:hypothetical protein